MRCPTTSERACSSRHAGTAGNTSRRFTRARGKTAARLLPPATRCIWRKISARASFFVRKRQLRQRAAAVKPTHGHLTAAARVFLPSSKLTTLRANIERRARGIRARGGIRFAVGSLAIEGPATLARIIFLEFQLNKTTLFHFCLIIVSVYMCVH